MKRAIFSALTSLTILALVPTSGHAAGPKLSADRLDLLDRRGYFTPAFKQAVHDLVDAKQAVVDAKIEQKKLDDELPDLEKQAAVAADKAAGLQQQLTALEHTDESDFAELQKKMGEPDLSADLQKQLADAVHASASDFEEMKKKFGEASAELDARRVLAQAYVWAYPGSPHQADAQHDLQDVQKKTVDLTQSLADAEAARVAAHDKLVARAQAHDLNIGEWRDFLFNMSKQDLLKFLGQPAYSTQDNWSYSGGWTEDPVTHQKVGLEVSFNAGRVVNVSSAAH
jgi:hypothetical protein